MELGAPHLRLTFEDMKRQPVTMSRKVLDFLDFPQSENKRILERNIPDYGARYNMFDFTHAALVYTKNTVWKGSRK